MTIKIPSVQQRLYVGDKLDTEWYRFLRAVQDAVNTGKADVVDADAAIAAIATALGSPDGTIANIPEQQDIDLSAITIVGTNIVSVTGALSTGLVEIGGTPLEDDGVGEPLGVVVVQVGRCGVDRLDGVGCGEEVAFTGRQHRPGVGLGVDEVEPLPGGEVVDQDAADAHGEVLGGGHRESRQASQMASMLNVSRRHPWHGQACSRGWTLAGSMPLAVSRR